VHVQTGGTRVEQHQVLFYLADAANGRLKHLLDEDSLLWVDHLVVAFLKLPVDVDVLNV
jgi:hypothetical protein